MTRTNIPGTSPYEPIIGFSRAVRIGNVVHVSGTGPVGAEDLSPAEQTRAVLAIIERPSPRPELLRARRPHPHLPRPRRRLGRGRPRPRRGLRHHPPRRTMVVATLSTPNGASRSKPKPCIPD